MMLLRIKEALPSMQPVNRKIALHILEQGSSVGFSSVRSLAQRVGVSEASIVRFAQSLGFKGYIELRKTLQEEIRRKLDPVDKVSLTNLDSLSMEARMSRLTSNEMRNLKKTLADMEISQVMRMMDGVAEARRLFVSGFGVSRSLIQVLEYALVGMLDKEIVVITGSVSDYSPRLNSFSSRDALIVMTFPSYSREAIQVASFAKNTGGRVFLFTDSPRCPIYSLADAVILCQNNSLLLTNSYVGVMAVMQIFINMLLLHDKDASVSRMQRTLDVEKTGYEELERSGESQTRQKP